MAVLDIVQYPDPRLLEVSKMISDFKENYLQKLIDDMIETMIHVNGAGLAAIQVGQLLRVAVIANSRDHSNILVVINPEILSMSGKRRTPEGCLSVQNAYDTVNRAEYVHVRFYDREGKMQEMETHGHLAHAFQHEIDHLNGKLFIHHLSPIRKRLFERKIKKLFNKK